MAKVKFATRWIDEGKVYEPGKAYDVHDAVASSLVRDGVAVEAPRQAQAKAPAQAGKSTTNTKES